MNLLHFFNPLFHRKPNALAVRECQEQVEKWLASPLVSRSPLAGTFQGSRGLAMTLRHDGWELLFRRFPQARAFFECAVAPSPQLQPWPARLMRPKKRNAYYLNLLLVGPGQSVGRHVDGTLRQATKLPDLLPEVVSVLYLQTLADTHSGQLVLAHQNKEVARIRPEVGTLIHFRGDLEHEVTPVEASETNVRISLVCEQYRVPEEQLKFVPKLQVHSKAAFQAHLAEAQNREVENLAALLEENVPFFD